MSPALIDSNTSNIPLPQQASSNISQNPTSKKVPPVLPKRPPTQAKPPIQNVQQKKMPRRSSKPILDWFHRKLAGTVKVKPSGKERNPIQMKATNRVSSSPLPTPGVSGRQQLRAETFSAARKKTISLNGDDEMLPRRYSDDGISTNASSLARDSMWSPTSALEADEDASVRPLPPSAPPSPSPSRSSSSYLSDPRTFRSTAASTKPTTLLSIDLNGNGMAHIAQAPLTPTRMQHHAHGRSSSNPINNSNLLPNGTSVTFSAFPPSTQSSALNTTQPGSVALTSVQAPLHTTHHPRNNPRPSSPPNDNASMLTLASSAFAMPGVRGGTQGWGSAPPSALGGSDSVSHFGGSINYADAESTSQFVLGDELMEERDVDASVRALRPRSSRRGSWESEVSRWSARIQAGPGTPSLTRERSVWTSNSARTGTFSEMDGDGPDAHTESVLVAPSVSVEESMTPSKPVSLAVDGVLVSPSVVSDSEPTPRNISQTIEGKMDSLKSPPFTARHSSTETIAQPADGEDKIVEKIVESRNYVDTSNAA